MMRICDVAAELDVGAATGHVGGDRNRARLAGLGDDLRFLLVEAGVQHLVLDAALLQHLGQSSLFSIETVPTSIGCLRVRARSISAMIASHFSRAVR